MSKHSEGMLVKEFCTQRTSKCSPCGKKYDDCVKNDPALAVSFRFPRIKKEQTGPVVQDISQNAHHILCVAEVTKVMSVDEQLETILKNTTYCVNDSVNMIALPLFAHTVYWYLLYEDAGPRQQLGGIMSSVPAPPFKDLPNHDFDHGSYNKEIETELNTLKGEIKEAEHNFESGELAGALNGISSTFRKKLKARAKRGAGGTHQAWEAACKGEADDWYLPFSLAAKPAERAFPKRVAKNRKRIQAAIDLLLNR